MLASQAVKRKASCALGKYRSVQRNVPLQHQGIGELLRFRRLSEMQSPCCVSSSVEVLRTRVAQVDGIGVNGAACPSLRLIVNHSSAGEILARVGMVGVS